MSLAFLLLKFIFSGHNISMLFSKICEKIFICFGKPIHYQKFKFLYCSILKKTNYLTIAILIALILGIIIGGLLNLYTVEINQSKFLSSFYDILIQVFDVGGRLFIKSLKMMMVPLVFVSIVCGTCSLVDIKQLGRIGAKTVSLYMLTTALAISIAIVIANLSFDSQSLKVLSKDVKPFLSMSPQPIKEVIVDLIPANPFSSFVEEKMIQIIFFAIFFGLAISSIKEKGREIVNLFESFNLVVTKMVIWLTYFAPIGVFCLITKTFATVGFKNISNLLIYFVVLLGCLLLQLFITYPAILFLFSRLNPLKLLKKMVPTLLFAFSTSSSNATLPITKKAVEEDLGVDRSLTSFSIPLGATINMDGTAMMQGVATIFIASIYGIELTLAQMATVVLTATLASIGTAGVPGVGLIMLVMVLQQVGLPIDAIGLILGVDRLLDMTRTAVNISGDAVVTCIVAKSEGKINLQTYNA